jgi:VanZ family protein
MAWHRVQFETSLSRAGKTALIGCVIALAILAWAPAHAVTRTTLGGHAEHLIAYLGTAIVMGLASRTTSHLAAQCFLLVGYAAILEAGQLYAEGRHASFRDFGFSAGGVLIGVALVWIARTLSTRSRSRTRDRSGAPVLGCEQTATSARSA